MPSPPLLVERMKQNNLGSELNRSIRRCLRSMPGMKEEEKGGGKGGGEGREEGDGMGKGGEEWGER